MAGLSKKRTESLRPLLQGLVEKTAQQHRIGFDPIEFPRRFQEKHDIEVVAFLSASLAYGRADLFREKIEQVLSLMGPSPSTWIKALTVAEASTRLRGFVYRFNVASDLAVLLLGLGAVLRTYGSLEALFLRNFDGKNLKAALQKLTRSIRAAAPVAEIESQLGPVRGVSHLLPSAEGDGAFKRLNMFLRWMVRGPDGLDLGIWKGLKPGALIIPLDTHVARIAWNLGLTRRKTQNWLMANEITEALRQVCPEDPIRFDFALCHFGMSGACPVRARKDNCEACLFRAECRVARRLGVK